MEVEHTEENIINDPYLLEEATYLNEGSKRWKNKQRTLVFASRGIPARYRHLMENIKSILPHHKTEQKWEKSHTLQSINEVAEMKSCNNTIFFECRKHKELYMWIARTPGGPSIKFQVLNVHTMGELKMTGNYLNGSRPLLTFDSSFNDAPHMRLMRELFIQGWGTPLYHPKSKPFHDHVLSFINHDNKIWLRHYQIVPETEEANNDPERQRLVEIGPRMVLDPIKIFSESFGGETIWSNEHYLTPAQMRTMVAGKLGEKYKERIAQRSMRLDHVENHASLKLDELDNEKLYASESESEQEDDDSMGSDFGGFSDSEEESDDE